MDIRRIRLPAALTLSASLAVLLAPPTGNAQSSGGIFEVRAYAIAAGKLATGGAYSAQAAVGQPATGEATGGPYAATIGLLRRRAPLADPIFGDGFEAPTP